MIKLTQSSTIACRLLLLLALIVTTYATTTELTYTAVEGVNDKFAHFATFFILSLLADLSFPKRDFDWAIWFPLACYGLLIEITQYQIPYRSFSWLDWVADGGGVFIYGFSILLIKQMCYPKKSS
jgi:VanZ family protein